MDKKQTDKKVKKILKLSKKELKMKFLEDNLKHKKQVYGTYIKALVKYNIKELGYSAIMYDELYHNLLMRKVEQCRDDNKSFCKLMFGDGKPLNDIEKIEHNIEYHDKLITRCRSIIEMAQDEVQEKIAKDAVEKSLAWLTTPELVGEIMKKKSSSKQEKNND